MDWYREKKKEKKWKKKGEGNTLGSAEDEQAQRAAALERMEAAAPAPAVRQQRSGAAEEAARARAAAAEGRAGGGKPKRRPASAAKAGGGGQGGGALSDLPSRYVPPAAAGGGGGGELPTSLSTGVQAPATGPVAQMGGLSAEEEERAAMEAAIALSLSESGGGGAAAAPSNPPPVAAPAAAPAADLSALRPAGGGTPPTDLDRLYGQLQSLLQQPAGPTALKTLSTVCANIVKTPTEPKFRSLKLSNPKIEERVVRVPGALGCLDALGFRLERRDATAFAILPMEVAAEGVQQALDLAIRPALDVIAQGKKPTGSQVQRCVTVCIPSASGPDPSRFDVPPEFFELSGGEAMQMHQSAQVKREAESVLRTRAMREGDAARKKRKYRRCLVRVRFPDQTVLQAVFLPREKLAKVYELVTDSLATPCPFSLFTHPLRTELADQDATLLDADLVPASLVNFRCLDEGSSQAVWLRPELMAQAVPLDDRTASSVPTGWSLEERLGPPAVQAQAQREQAAARADAAAARILQKH